MLAAFQRLFSQEQNVAKCELIFSTRIVTQDNKIKNSDGRHIILPVNSVQSFYDKIHQHVSVVLEEQNRLYRHKWPEKTDQHLIYLYLTLHGTFNGRLFKKDQAIVGLENYKQFIDQLGFSFDPVILNILDGALEDENSPYVDLSQNPPAAQRTRVGPL